MLAPILSQWGTRRLTCLSKHPKALTNHLSSGSKRLQSPRWWTLSRVQVYEEESQHKETWPLASRGHSTVTKFLKEKQKLRHCTRLSVKPYMWATDTLDRIVTEPSRLSIKKVPIMQMFSGEAIQVYPRCNLMSGLLAVSIFLADICAPWLWPYSTVSLVVSTVNQFLTKSVRLQHRSWPASPPPPRLSGRAIMMNECAVERQKRWGSGAEPVLWGEAELEMWCVQNRCEGGLRLTVEQVTACEDWQGSV